jgi:hypothetical protein
MAPLFEEQGARFLVATDAAGETVAAHAARVAERVREGRWRWTFPLFRPNDIPAAESLFSTPTVRDVLEEQFLKAGVRIIQLACTPNPHMRPLGFDMVESLGFGAVFVSCFNISNNCPLALWYGDPSQSSGPLSKWYPLFPRKERVPRGTPSVEAPRSEEDIPF